jgi:hypothetical protein
MMNSGEDTSERTAWNYLNENRPLISFANAPEAQWYLTPTEFWRIFTAPSLKAMLHYSVNSYNDKAVVIDNPLALAYHEAKLKKEQEGETPKEVPA